MIPRIYWLFLAGLLTTARLFADGPVDAARADLDKAVKELTETQREYADLRRGLYRDINRLDDEALTLAKELRTLSREEEERAARAKSLEREVESRKTDFNYAAGVLNQYSKALVTRLHPAENQRYLAEVERIDQRAASNIENPQAELAERHQVLELGLERLGLVAGGHRFEGKALRNGNEAMEGTLLTVGPAVFFASTDKSFEGVATFAATGTELPTVVAVPGDGTTIAKAVFEGGGPLPLDGTMGKAMLTAEAQDTLMETIEKGGMVGHCILLLGAISGMIVIFKLIEIHRFPVPDRGTINRILDHLVTGDPTAAKKEADLIPGLPGDVVRAGVENFYGKRKVLEESIFEKLIDVKPKLERFLPFLALTASTGPLLGLLGTVLGIIKTFQAMVIYGTGNAKNFSAGISEALITTAEGLVVAIPVLILHGLMKGLAKGKAGEVESIAIALVNGTSELDKSNKPYAGKSKSDDEDEDFELTSVTTTPA
jgi:biopolymer transport protein ExbB